MSIKTITYGIDGYGTFFEPCVKGTEWHSIRELYTTSNEKGVFTTSIDIYRYIYKTTEITEDKYNEMLYKLQDYKIEKKSIFKEYEADEDDAKKYKLKVEVFWLREKDAREFIKNMEVR